MPRLTQRLARLEKAIQALGAGGTCHICFGSPIAVIHIIHENEPSGPGLRETGECYLATDYDTHISDDLRCRECGAEAVQVHLIDVGGIGPAPRGRRVSGRSGAG